MIRPLWKGVTSVEQARALPEVRHSIFDYTERLLQTDEPGVGKRGDLIRTPVVRPFVPRPMAGDEILLFVDADGRSMQVVYTENGPAKTEFRL